MANVWNYLANEGDYPDLDADSACKHLSAAIQCRTITYLDSSLMEWKEFDLLHMLMREAYPHVFSHAEVKEIDHSLLIRIPGSDPSLRPIMLMGHQDVVPVVAGSEKNWTHPPFSGYIDDTYIWGRGAIDMKDQTIGILEAAEYILAHEQKLERSLILSFGQDEEGIQSGASRIADLLAHCNTKLEFLIDEGDYRITDGSLYGANGKPLRMVHLAEKGYCDLQLVSHSAGGHSSNPFHGTSLAILSEAIHRITQDHHEPKLIPLVRLSFETIADCINAEPLHTFVSNIDAHSAEIAQLCAKDTNLFPLVVTTTAPTMIEGSSAQPNVMPQNMRAVINFRILPGETCAGILAHVQDLLKSLPVEVQILPNSANNPSQISRYDSYGVRCLQAVSSRYFVNPKTKKGLRVVPALATGASDARMYEKICDSCLRYSAFVVDDEEDEHGVHGTNERVTRRAYLQGIRFMIRLIQSSCMHVQK